MRRTDAHFHYIIIFPASPKKVLKNLDQRSSEAGTASSQAPCLMGALLCGEMEKGGIGPQWPNGPKLKDFGYKLPCSPLLVTSLLPSRVVLPGLLNAGLLRAACVAEEFTPNSATIIVSEPNTGHILGMANYPDFDLNNSMTASAWERSIRWLRKAVRVNSPGSAM